MILDFIEDLEYCGHVPKISKNPVMYNLVFPDSFFNRIYLETENEILQLRLNFNKNDIYDSIREYVKLSDVYEFDVMDEKTIKETYKIDASIFPCISKTKKYGPRKKYYLVPQLTEALKELIKIYNCSGKTFTHYDFCILSNLCKDCMNKKNSAGEFALKKLFSSVNIGIIDRIDKLSLENQINSNNINQEDNYEKINFILTSARENKKFFDQFGLNSKVEEINNDEKQKHI